MTTIGEYVDGLSKERDRREITEWVGDGILEMLIASGGKFEGDKFIFPRSDIERLWGFEIKRDNANGVIGSLGHRKGSNHFSKSMYEIGDIESLLYYARAIYDKYKNDGRIKQETGY